MQLIIKNDLTALEEIEFNFDELKEGLINKLSTYQGLVYNEAQIKEAKEDRADLNKLKTAIENKRKEVKKAVNQPYADFEVKVKELVSLVQQPIDEIDSQVSKAVEEARKDKRIQVEMFFDNYIGLYKDALPFSRIMSDKWFLASTSMKSAEDEIVGLIAYFVRDYNVIVCLESKFEEILLKLYVDTHDLAMVMEKKKELEEAEKVVVKVQEEEKKVEVKAPTPVADGLVSFTIKITTDKDRMNLLKDFIVMNQIKYERIV